MVLIASISQRPTGINFNTDFDGSENIKPHFLVKRAPVRKSGRSRKNMK